MIPTLAGKHHQGLEREGKKKPPGPFQASGLPVSVALSVLIQNKQGRFSRVAADNSHYSQEKASIKG